MEKAFYLSQILPPYPLIEESKGNKQPFTSLQKSHSIFWGVGEVKVYRCSIKTYLLGLLRLENSICPPSIEMCTEGQPFCTHHLVSSGQPWEANYYAHFTYATTEVQSG